jgi:hypothetical protein
LRVVARVGGFLTSRSKPTPAAEGANEMMLIDLAVSREIPDSADGHEEGWVWVLGALAERFAS